MIFPKGRYGVTLRLRAKSYAFDMDGDEFKKCKGVKKYVVNKEITLSDYKIVYFQEDNS